jgi:hypothetical protein
MIVGGRLQIARRGGTHNVSSTANVAISRDEYDMEIAARAIMTDDTTNQAMTSKPNEPTIKSTLNEIAAELNSALVSRFKWFAMFLDGCFAT